MREGAINPGSCSHWRRSQSNQAITQQLELPSNHSNGSIAASKKGKWVIRQGREAGSAD